MGRFPEGARRFNMSKPAVDQEAPTDQMPSRELMPDGQRLGEADTLVREPATQPMQAPVAEPQAPTLHEAETVPMPVADEPATEIGGPAARVREERAFAAELAADFRAPRAEQAVAEVAQTTQGRLTRLGKGVAEWFGFGDKPDYDKQTNRFGGVAFWGTKLVAFTTIALLVARGDGKAPEKGDAAPVDSADAPAQQEQVEIAPAPLPRVQAESVQRVTTIDESEFQAPIVRGQVDVTGPGTAYDMVAGEHAAEAEVKAARRAELAQARQAVQGAQQRIENAYVAPGVPVTDADTLGAELAANLEDAQAEAEAPTVQFDKEALQARIDTVKERTRAGSMSPAQSVDAQPATGGLGDYVAPIAPSPEHQRRILERLRNGNPTVDQAEARPRRVASQQAERVPAPAATGGYPAFTETEKSRLQYTAEQLRQQGMTEGEIAIAMQKARAEREKLGLDGGTAVADSAN